MNFLLNISLIFVLLNTEGVCSSQMDGYQLSGSRIPKILDNSFVLNASNQNFSLSLDIKEERGSVVKKIIEVETKGSFEEGNSDDFKIMSPLNRLRFRIASSKTYLKKQIYRIEKLNIESGAIDRNLAKLRRNELRLFEILQ